MNEQEKTTMNIIEPEGLSSCGADSGTWCGQALTRVLIGMTLTGLTLNVLCLNYILPAIGMVFLLVGLRALRRENAGFKGGYVIAIIRTFYITVWMILDTTIYADVLTGTTAAVVLTLFNLVIVLAQVVCLWSGLKALRQKAGFEAKCGAAAALIVWNVVLCALGVMNWSGWIVFGIIMIVLYIIIMRRLFALAGELDNAGCTITPVPVRVKDWQLVLSLAVLLAAGMACGYAFGGSYPMEWTPLDNSAQAEVQSTKAKLLELGFPEAVLNDLSAEDIASCEGATQILSRTEDKPVNDGREVTTQTGENSYQIDTVYDAKELRLTGVAVRVKQTDGTERWIIFHHFLWTQPMNYCGTEAVQLWPSGQSDWWPDGDRPRAVRKGRSDAHGGVSLARHAGHLHDRLFRQFAEQQQLDRHVLHAARQRKSARLRLPPDTDRAGGYLRQQLGQLHASEHLGAVPGADCEGQHVEQQRVQDHPVRASVRCDRGQNDVLSTVI